MAEQLYLYPPPISLDRDHAETERIRLAYFPMCAT